MKPPAALMLVLVISHMVLPMKLGPLVILPQTLRPAVLQFIRDFWLNEIPASVEMANPDSRPMASW